MSSTIEYEIRPQLEFGRGFRLFRSGTLLSEVREQTRDDFRIEVGTARHRILTQSQFGVRHELVRGSDEVLAVAERPVTVSPRYEVRLPTGQPIQITPVATYGLKCHV
ncbi:MAG: hypothetical protein KDC38_20640, partial [Planctomycetes bacterium]|nr:hypothetical protein [Planctomycetota bacterium]